MAIELTETDLEIIQEAQREEYREEIVSLRERRGERRERKERERGAVHEKPSVISHSNVRCRHSTSQHETSSIRRPCRRNQVPDNFTKETSRKTVNRQVSSRIGLPRDGCKLHS